MTDSTPLPLETPVRRTPLRAILVLDGTGRVTAANPAALQLWQAAPGDLIGRPFPTLLSFDIVSADPDFLGAQWEALTAALDRELTLAVASPTGTVQSVQARLERQVGTDNGYLAALEIPAERPHGSEVPAWQVLAENGSAGVFDLNFAAGCVQFSPAWKRLLGFAPAELPDTLETWHRLIHPEDSAAAPDKLARRSGHSGAPSARPFDVEFRMQHRLGHWIWLQCTGVQGISAGGQLERVVGIHTDITERKELEESLIVSDARLQTLASEGPLGAFEVDFTSGQTWISPAFARLLGHRDGALPATPEALAAVFGLEDDNGLAAWLQQFTQEAGGPMQAVQLRSADGTAVSALLGIQYSTTRRRLLERVTGFVVVPPDGDARPPVGSTPVAADPDPLTRALAAAVDHVAEGVILTDPTGRVQAVNASAVRLLRRSAPDLVGSMLAEVFRLRPQPSREQEENPVASALAAETPLPLKTDDLLATTEDESVPIVWTARRVSVGDRAVGVAVIFRHPGEMTLTPDELVEVNRLDSLAFQAGAIAHDFNNLLTTVLGALSLAVDNHDYSGLGDAEKAANAARGLTQQLLTFSRGGASPRTLCAPRDLLRDALKIAAAAASAEIDLQVSPHVESVMVDRAQLLQVLQNLIINALQAMPPPPHRARLQLRADNAHLAAEQVPGLPPGAYVELEIRDNGRGIPAEHLEKIFAPFFTTKKHGTGLGLATVLSIVRKHGGQVAVDSQPDVGTVFSVYLPPGRAAEVQARRAAALRFGTGRVLFMDDDPAISTLTAKMLESLDYRYDLARDGDEAIALYKRYLNIGRPYDAVIMDLTVVGGMGGEECYEHLRKLDPDVRAIIASGYDNEEIAREYLERGFCGYLPKPYRVADLGKVLKAVLG